ncbi:MAG: hypothetical protein KIT09_33495 [Bryobacteraceae bacterium]|nr:hypothetical protein [Bryobacteraceae bacterium]
MHILRRATLLSMKIEVPVWTTIILLSRRHAGADVPETVAEDRGCIQVSMKPRVAALWKMRPHVVLEDPNLEALPLVGAMKATPAELDEAIRRLSAIGDRE